MDTTVLIGSSYSIGVSEWGSDSGSRNRCKGVLFWRGWSGSRDVDGVEVVQVFPTWGCIGGSIYRWEGRRGEGELESSGEPTRGSRDSSEDFVVVVSSED